jgi:hypothetical protein
MYLKKEHLPHAETDVFVNIFASGKVGFLSLSHIHNVM